jgi:hypothetical protein
MNNGDFSGHTTYCKSHSADWLAGVRAERRRCLRIVADAAIGTGNERAQLVADLVRAIEGSS